MRVIMYSLSDCIRLGLLTGALFGITIETLVALMGADTTALQFLLRSTYGIARASGLS